MVISESDASVFTVVNKKTTVVINSVGTQKPVMFTPQYAYWKVDFTAGSGNVVIKNSFYGEVA